MLNITEDPYSLTPGDFYQDGVDEIYDDFGGPRQKQKSIKDLNVSEVRAPVMIFNHNNYNNLRTRLFAST